MTRRALVMLLAVLVACLSPPRLPGDGALAGELLPAGAHPATAPRGTLRLTVTRGGTRAPRAGVVIVYATPPGEALTFAPPRAGVVTAQSYDPTTSTGLVPFLHKCPSRIRTCDLGHDLSGRALPSELPGNQSVMIRRAAGTRPSRAGYRHPA